MCQNFGQMANSLITEDTFKGEAVWNLDDLPNLTHYLGTLGYMMIKEIIMIGTVADKTKIDCPLHEHESAVLMAIIVA